MSGHDPADPRANADLAAAYDPAPRGDHLDDETWERLSEGTLAAAVRERALDHVVTCRRCAEIDRGLQAFEREAAAFDPAARRPATPALPAWVQTLAAGLVVAAAAWVFLRETPRPPDVTQTPASPVPAIEKPEVQVSAESALVVRGGEADASAYLEELRAALVPYRENRFADATTALAALAKTHPQAPEPPLYEGISWLLLGRAREAVASLERASRLAPADLKPIAEYHLALALRASGDIDTARERLTALCRGDGPYRVKACREAALR